MSREELPNIGNSFRTDIKNFEQDKKYKLCNLQFRIDEETGKICIFTLESESFREDLPGVRARFTEKSVSSGHIIYSTFRSLSGHTYSRVYYNKEDEERYGVRCYYRDILTQLFGFYDNDKEYTLQELRVLESQINKLKENARYTSVFSLKYDDSYTGKRLLEGLHMAKGWINTLDGEKKADFICLEKQYFSIKIDGDGTLNVLWNGKVIESTAWEIWKGELVQAESIEDFDHISRRTKKLKGFTPYALTRLIDLYIKETEESEK